MTVVGEIGPCSVCRRIGRLERAGCARCVNRLGLRFVELAARVRGDPRFAAMVLESIRNPKHRDWFRELFGDCEAQLATAAPDPLGSNSPSGRGMG